MHSRLLGTFFAILVISVKAETYSERYRVS